MKILPHTGFTLIELLVVISIISLLSAIGAASLNSARTKARDTRRLSDMRQIATALELYYDKNNTVPGGPPPATYKCTLHNNIPPSYYFPTGLQGLVTEGFLQQIPCDPKGPELCDAGGSNCTGYGSNYYYLAQSNGWWGANIGYCGTEPGVNYGYVLSFRPETSTFQLPKFSVTSSTPAASSTCGGGTSDCCIAGLKI